MVSDETIWVRKEEAFERLPGSRARIQRLINAGKYPTRQGRKAGTVDVGIPANTPPSLRVQLSEARLRVETLERELDSERDGADELNAKLVDATLRIEDQQAQVAWLRGWVDEEKEYHRHLANEVRIQFANCEELREENSEILGRVREAMFVRFATIFLILAASAVFLTAQAIEKSFGRDILRVILDTFDLSLLA